jgi:hypothetical protein
MRIVFMSSVDWGIQCQISTVNLSRSIRRCVDTSSTSSTLNTRGVESMPHNCNPREVNTVSIYLYSYGPRLTYTHDKSLSHQNCRYFPMLNSALQIPRSQMVLRTSLRAATQAAPYASRARTLCSEVRASDVYHEKRDITARPAGCQVRVPLPNFYILQYTG